MQKLKTSSKTEDRIEEMAQQVKILVATPGNPHHGRKPNPTSCLLTCMCVVAHVLKRRQ